MLDRHGIMPAFLVDHPVATTPEAAAVLRSILDSGRCEIGGHLHPWVNPPSEEDPSGLQTFACNLPPELEQRKLQHLTQVIGDAFGRSPTVFKAGAYGIGPNTSGFLAELGYRVDSSVVPYTGFAALGGPDFLDCGPQPFLTREGLVEIPLTVGFAGLLSPLGPRAYPALTALRHLRAPGIAARLGLIERLRLSPESHGLNDMIRLTRAALARGERLFMLAMHSSTLLPGATQYAATAEERDAVLRRIDEYAAFFHTTLGGVSLSVSEAATRLIQDSER